MKLQTVILFLRPDGRWMCGVAALIIATIRLFSTVKLPGTILTDQVYIVWFGLAAIALLLTARSPWRKRARFVSAMSAGAFIMLAIDVVARSATSAAIPCVFAYRLIWESLRCWKL